MLTLHEWCLLDFQEKKNNNNKMAINYFGCYTNRLVRVFEFLVNSFIEYYLNDGKKLSMENRFRLCLSFFSRLECSHVYCVAFNKNTFLIFICV